MLNRKKTVVSAGEEVLPEKQPSHIVDSVIWRGNVGVIYGPAGCGKSSLTNSAAGDMVLSRLMWGLAGWQCAPNLRVLILDIENRPGETRAAIRRATNRAKELKNLFVAELDGQGFDINEKRWKDWLRTHIKKHKFDVLIIDNLNNFTSSNIITDSYKMKRVVTFNRSLARRYNIALIVVHHTGHLIRRKDGSFVNARPVGGTSLHDDADFEFQVLRDKSDTNQMHVTCTKMRSRVARVHNGDKFLLHYDPETTRIEPAGFRKRRQGEPSNNVKISLIKTLITNHGNNNLSRTLGVVKGTVCNWGHGTRVPKGEYWRRIEELAKRDGLL